MAESRVRLIDRPAQDCVAAPADGVIDVVDWVKPVACEGLIAGGVRDWVEGVGEANAVTCGVGDDGLLSEEFTAGPILRRCISASSTSITVVTAQY